MDVHGLPAALAAFDSIELALVIVAAIGALLALDASHSMRMRRAGIVVAVMAMLLAAISMAVDVEPAVWLVSLGGLVALAVTTRWLAGALGLTRTRSA